MITFLVEYFSPTVLSLLSNLMDRARANASGSESKHGDVGVAPSNIPNHSKNTLIAAGMVQIVTELSSLLMEMNMNMKKDESNFKDRSASYMINSLLDIVMMQIPNLPSSFTSEFILMHPLRLYQNQSVTPFQYQKENDDENNYFIDEDDEIEEEEDEYDAMREAEELIINDSVQFPLLCHEKEDFGLDFDSLCGMNVCWNSNGITFLAAHSIMAGVREDAEDGLKDGHGNTWSKDMGKTSPSVLMVSPVHSPDMIYAIYFPHATGLIRMSQRREISTSIAKASSFRYFEMGMDILYYLHGMLGPCSLNGNISMRGTNIDNASRETVMASLSSSGYFISGPLSPVGVIQLLLNTLINISSSSEAAVSASPLGQRDRGSQLPVTTPSKKHLIMTPQGIISTIRNILSVYKNHTQLSAISKLIQTSPFPFLIPILLDFARNIVASNISSTQEKVEVMIMVMHILAPLVSNMISCFDKTGLDDNGGFHDFVCDEENLMEHIETFCSVVSLVRLVFLALWGETKRNNSTFAIKIQVLDMTSKIRTFQEDLQSLLNRMGQGDTPHAMFRVYLLENALIDLFTVVAVHEISIASQTA
uniref:Uncharacterized protein n=1 Tax=Chaetoceros debilis TaxID=122233 RepID=A0A7S3VEZ7_9STRA